jgi:HSP20 family molecular chaperone IbpA
VPKKSKDECTEETAQEAPAPAEVEEPEVEGTEVAVEEQPEGEPEADAATPETKRSTEDAIGDAARKVLSQVRGTARSLAQEAADLMKGRPWQPRIDLCIKGQEIILRADLPGVDHDSVDVVANPNAVTIQGSMPAAPDEEGVVYYERERRVHGFYREVGLPQPVHSDSITATMRRGVLEVRMPIVEENRVKPGLGTTEA